MKLSSFTVKDVEGGAIVEVTFDDGTVLSQPFKRGADIMIVALGLKKLANAAGELALD